MTPQRYMELRNLADELIASCDGGSTEHHDVINDLSLEECRVLDGMALECADCNQWYAANEMREDGGAYICVDCSH